MEFVVWFLSMEGWCASCCGQFRDLANHELLRKGEKNLPVCLLPYLKKKVDFFGPLQTDKPPVLSDFGPVLRFPVQFFDTAISRIG